MLPPLLNGSDKGLTFTFLVTGFGPFPGAPHNPSLDLIAELQRRKARFARVGIRLETRALPVLYAEIRPLLAQFTQEIAPDAILLFGLAGRRPHISIETRACNRVNPLHPDASGLCVDNSSLVPKAPMFIGARIPATPIVASLRRADITSRLSQNAGTYLCNAALYYALAARHAASIGFVHIPRPARRNLPASSVSHPRPTLTEIVKAAEIAILQVATAAQHERLAQRV